MIGDVLRRGSAIALLGLCLFLVWMVLVVPYQSRRADLRVRIDQARTAAARFADAAHEAGGHAMGRLPVGLTLAGRSRAVAQAMLQERLDGVLERSGGSRTASTVLDPIRVGERLHLRARVEGDLTIDALADALHHIETGLPLVFVEEVEITRRDRRGDDAAADAPVPLDLRLTVSAPVNPSQFGAEASPRN